MKVLSVQHYPVFGGPHNEILRLEPGLNARGVQTIVVLSDDPGNAAARLDGHVELRTLPLARARRSFDPRLNLQSAARIRADVARLRGAIRLEKADLVKVHGPHNPQGALAAALERVPVVWVISSTRVPTGFRHAGMRLVDRLADSVLVTGRALLDFYPAGAALGDRAFIYYPPVDVKAFRPLSEAARLAVRSELGLPTDRLVVGTVANVNPQKGIHVFVDAAARIRKQRPDTHFVVVGAYGTAQAAYFEQVKDQAAAAGLLPGYLEFLGERSEIAPLLASFDVSTVTSVPLSEGIPTTALEAMSCGVPTVTTAVGAVHEAVLDGDTGFVVPGGDADGLATRVLELLNDPKSRRKMGASARERALAHFTVGDCVGVHLRAYHHALSRPASLHGNRCRRHWRFAARYD